MVENVFSMAMSEVPKFSKALGVTPIMLDAACFSHAERRRYYWLSWKVEKSPKVTIVPHEFDEEVKVDAHRKDPGFWQS